jgi:cystathionine beta-lyase/cystathionine gamma-synthase
LTPAARGELGISGGTIRLSVGVESPDYILGALRDALSPPLT